MPFTLFFRNSEYKNSLYEICHFSDYEKCLQEGIWDLVCDKCGVEKLGSIKEKVILKQWLPKWAVEKRESQWEKKTKKQKGGVAHLNHNIHPTPHTVYLKFILPSLYNEYYLYNNYGKYDVTHLTWNTNTKKIQWNLIIYLGGGFLEDITCTTHTACTRSVFSHLFTVAVLTAGIDAKTIWYRDAQKRNSILLTIAVRFTSVTDTEPRHR